MFTIIEPKNQNTHQSSIDALLDLLCIYQDFHPSLGRKKKATFIIAQDNQHGVYGGAILYPQQVYKIEEEVLQDDYEDTFRGAFINFRPQIQEFWMARICFCLEANLSPDGLKGTALCEKFYNELHNAFVDFGESKNTEFLAFYLCSFETIYPPFYIKWLYLPIWNSDDESGLTHGILSLTGKKFIPRAPRKSTLRNMMAGGEKSAASVQERQS